MQHPKRVRIWIRYRGDWVRLTLQDGKQVEIYDGGATEEGYSHTAETYEYDATEGLVRSSCRTDAQDCDGRITHFWEGFWPVGGETTPGIRFNLDGDPVETDIIRPVWTRGSASQRDYSAEAMGY